MNKTVNVDSLLVIISFILIASCNGLILIKHVLFVVKIWEELNCREWRLKNLELQFVYEYEFFYKTNTKLLLFNIWLLAQKSKKYLWNYYKSPLNLSTFLFTIQFQNIRITQFFNLTLQFFLLHILLFQFHNQMSFYFFKLFRFIFNYFNYFRSR